MQKNLGTAPLRTNQRFILAETRTLFSRLLPILVFLSFVWLNFYDTTAGINNLFINFAGMENLGLNLGISIFISGLIDYIIFEFLFFIYRFFLGFSIYSFMIPKQVLLDKFRFWYFIRNIVLGLIFNIRFFFPYIASYLCIFELICNFSFIICMFFDLSKEYIEPLVAQFVFKTLSVPVVLYEIYVVVRLMVGVLWVR